MHRASPGLGRLRLNTSPSSSEGPKTSTLLPSLSEPWVKHSIGGKLRQRRRASHILRGRKATQFQLFQYKLGPLVHTDPDFRDHGFLSTVMQDGTKHKSSKLKFCGLDYWSILKFWGMRKEFSFQSLTLTIFSSSY